MMPPLRMFLNLSRLRLFDDAALGGEDDVLVFVPGFFVGLLALNADGGGDFFAGLELEEIGDAAAFGGAAHLGDLKDALDVAPAFLGEEHEVIVRGGGEEVLDEIAVLLRLPFAGLHAHDAFAAAALGAVGGDGGALEEAVVGDGDDGALIGDEVLHGDLALRGGDLGAARVAVLLLNLAQLVLDDFQDALFFRAGYRADP